MFSGLSETFPMFPTPSRFFPAFPGEAAPVGEQVFVEFFCACLCAEMDAAPVRPRSGPRQAQKRPPSGPEAAPWEKTTFWGCVWTNHRFLFKSPWLMPSCLRRWVSSHGTLGGPTDEDLTVGAAKP